MAARGTRGGRRQGTPGRSYENRSDLGQSYAPVSGLTTPAAGAQSAPPGPPPSPGPVSQNGTAAPPGVSPDHVTPLDAPTDRPAEPVTAGLPTGPGPAPSAGNDDTSTARMIAHLPWLVAAAANSAQAPRNITALITYLQAAKDRAGP